MFPNAHPQSISDMFIHLTAQSFHAAYLEVVNPPSDKLIKFLYFVTIAYAPASTGKFFHPFLKLHN